MTDNGAQASSCEPDICGEDAPCWNLTHGSNVYSYTCNRTVSLKKGTHGPNMHRCNLDGSFIKRNTLSYSAIKGLTGFLYFAALFNVGAALFKFWNRKPNGHKILETDAAGVWVFFYSLYVFLHWYLRATVRYFDWNSHEVPVANHLEQSQCGYHGFGLAFTVALDQIGLIWYIAAVVYAFRHYHDASYPADKDKPKLIVDKLDGNETYPAPKYSELLSKYAGGAIAFSLIVGLVLFVWHPEDSLRSCCERLLTANDFHQVVFAILAGLGLLGSLVTMIHWWFGKVSINDITGQIAQKSFGQTYLDNKLAKWWAGALFAAAFLRGLFSSIRLVFDVVAYSQRKHPDIFYEYKNWDWMVNGFFWDFVMICLLTPISLMNIGKAIMPEAFSTTVAISELASVARGKACQRMELHRNVPECAELLLRLNSTHDRLANYADDLSYEEQIYLQRALQRYCEQALELRKKHKVSASSASASLEFDD